MPPSSQVENLSGQVTREYLYDGHIVLYALQDPGQLVTDTWADNLIHEMQQWDRHFPYLCVQDFTQAGTNPYLQQRAEDVFLNMPTDLEVYFAIIAPHSVVGLFWIVLAKNMVKKYPLLKFDYQTFSNREEGLAWVEQFLR